MVFNTFLEEPSMATLEQKIIDELKLALEYQEPTGDYAQWLMGVSLPSVIERKNDQLVITARVVVKTSDSEYVDGMDIAFSLDPIIDPNYYQNSPDYHGGSIEDSVNCEFLQVPGDRGLIIILKHPSGQGFSEI